MARITTAIRERVESILSSGVDTVTANSVNTEELGINNNRVFSDQWQEYPPGDWFNDGEIHFFQEDHTDATTSADATNITGSGGWLINFSSASGRADFEAAAPPDYTGAHPLNQNLQITVAFTTDNENDTILYIQNGNGTNGLIVRIRWNDNASNELEYYDGNAGSYVSTGVTVGSGAEVQLHISLDFGTDTYDLEGYVGGTQAVGETGLGFSSSQDYLARIAFINGGQGTGDTLTLDRMNFDTPTVLCMGDSITQGTRSGLNDLGLDAWPTKINEKQSEYLFVRNQNGSSHGEVSWSYDVMENYMDATRPTWVIVAHFIHSVSEEAIGKQEYLNQYMSTMSKIESNGAQPVGALMPVSGDHDFDLQKDWITDLQALLEAHNIPYVNFWDALDSSPNDGAFDSRDASLYDDATHPNAAGLEKMAKKTVSDLGL